MFLPDLWTSFMNSTLSKMVFNLNKIEKFLFHWRITSILRVLSKNEHGCNKLFKNISYHASKHLQCVHETRRSYSNFKVSILIVLLSSFFLTSEEHKQIKSLYWHRCFISCCYYNGNGHSSFLLPQGNKNTNMCSI